MSIRNARTTVANSQGFDGPDAGAEGWPRPASTAGRPGGRGHRNEPGPAEVRELPRRISGNPHAALKDLTETTGTLCS